MAEPPAWLAPREAPSRTIWDLDRRGPSATLEQRVLNRVMVERIVALGDPRHARVLSVDPPRLELMPSSVHPDGMVLAAAVELIDAAAAAAEVGAPVVPELAWCEVVERRRLLFRRRELQVRLPAPLMLRASFHRPVHSFFESLARFISQQSEGLLPPLEDPEVLPWLTARVPNRARLEKALRRWRAAVMPPPIERDFDRMIALGEQELSKAGAFARSATLLELAAAYHHRGCVRRSEDLDAFADLGRAIELDPYGAYLTTRALLLDEQGTIDAARADHDAAVDALQALSRKSEDRIPGGEVRIDPKRIERDLGRALHARAVHRHRAGDPPGARQDVVEALRHHATPALETALEKLSKPDT